MYHWLVKLTSLWVLLVVVVDVRLEERLFPKGFGAT